MNYRPICDTWILGRPKHKYYGAYPAGFLHRARQTLGVPLRAPVLHVCAGKIREYPYRGLGPNDKTLDLDPSLKPDYLRDARLPLPYHVIGQFDVDARQQYADGKTERDIHNNELWDAILIDRPYTEDDADHYFPGRDKLPPANLLVKNAMLAVPVGGKVGMLDYIWPQPPKNATEVAVIHVICGRNNRSRVFTVFERLT